MTYTYWQAHERWAAQMLRGNPLLRSVTLTPTELRWEYPVFDVYSPPKFRRCECGQAVFGDNTECAYCRHLTHLVSQL